MDYWYLNIGIKQLEEKYGNDKGFNFKSRDQLLGLLHNDWKEQELNTLILDYQRVIERARINRGILLREEKRALKLERQNSGRQRKLKKLTQLELQIVLRLS